MPIDKLFIKPFVLVKLAFFIGESRIPFLKVFGYLVPDFPSSESVVIVVVTFRAEGHDVLLDSETALTPADIMRVGYSRRTTDHTSALVSQFDLFLDLFRDRGQFGFLMPHRTSPSFLRICEDIPPLNI